MGDGWCIECGDEFHGDDCGGYNPPCQRCGLCLGCCGGTHGADDYPSYEDDPAPADGA